MKKTATKPPDTGNILHTDTCADSSLIKLMKKLSEREKYVQVITN